MSSITMRQMLEAGVHFGHQKRFWNPKMSPFIFGVRHQIHIINLEHTLPLYQEALNFIGRVAAQKGRILFVGTKRSAQDIIREEAQRCGMPYVDHRWLGGMLTNYKTIRQSIRRLKEIETMQGDGSLERMTKKEGLMLTRELAKLKLSLNGIKDMGGLPDALFVIDIGHEKTAVAEARRLSIPVIGVVDTNYDPANIDYMIPGNDDSQRAIRLYCQGAADAILDARQLIIEHAQAKAAKAPVAAEPEKQKVVIKKIARKPSADAAPDKENADVEVAAPAKKATTHAKPTAAKKPAAATATAKATAMATAATATEKKPKAVAQKTIPKTIIKKKKSED